MLLLMSSQYMSPVHSAVHPPRDEVVEVVMPPVVIWDDEVIEVEVAVVVGVVLGVVLEVVLGLVLGVEVAVEVEVMVAVGVVLEVVIVVVVMFSRFENVRLSERIELNIQT